MPKASVLEWFVVEHPEYSAARSPHHQLLSERNNSNEPLPVVVVVVVRHDDDDDDKIGGTVSHSDILVVELEVVLPPFFLHINTELQYESAVADNPDGDDNADDRLTMIAADYDNKRKVRSMTWPLEKMVGFVSGKTVPVIERTSFVAAVGRQYFPDFCNLAEGRCYYYDGTQES